MLSDLDLVAGTAARQQAALAELYRRHHDKVHRMASIMGGSTYADDVSQDVFLRLWHQPDRFDPARGSLTSFLLLQARSRCIDLLRSGRARHARETNDQQWGGHRASAETEALIQHAGDAVRHALGRLPTAELDAIALAYFGGHTYREVAGLLGQPEGTTKSRIASGMRRLRAALVDPEDTESRAS